VGLNYYLTNEFELSGNYAFFDFSIKEQNVNDVLLPNAPAHKFNVGGTYRSNGLAAQLNVKYVPSYDWAAGIYKGRILAYTLVNVNISYDLTEYLTLAGTVTNLLDREHYQIFGGSLIGRRALASVTARF
jgi:outer membrane receptor protein involved in Fe transport